ncbi:MULTISPECIES: zinc ribbon domain-containing protein [Edwardsiella]|uniref:Zinc ribbon domain-containing protein n=2 Tax=Edwardsiella anguillarum TaxID=1821960 RepID=A0ABY8SGB6_9GAMM|nr:MULTISPECIES: zinc ribbon domain-containing protein [Edwardsiella]AIJ06985.1 putative phage-related membrane protein [Edwardsiella anguillarum ET080813]EKS7766615.1 zinc ribbon domain-containing protein [Edwardsiella piscicida]KAB0593562.1 zinc ribbon domain-containing protein [Edwardsiella anguillarum]UBU79887.1 zinc ribbon domain-containing protein [Edwardsiella piscicida]UBU94656.1 zinc ribbon domain-containing protein [Edwardsiella sp. LADL05-105]
MELFIVAALLGLIPAFIAQSKGRSFGAWWLYGFFLFIVAIIHALLISKNDKAIEDKQLENGMRKCPFCAELVKKEAIKCKHCGSDIPAFNVAKESNVDYLFVPSCVPINEYIKVDAGRKTINSSKVADVVYKLRKINPDVSSEWIEKRYSDDIEFILSELPHDLREEFSMVYRSILMA